MSKHSLLVCFLLILALSGCLSAWGQEGKNAEAGTLLREGDLLMEELAYDSAANRYERAAAMFRGLGDPIRVLEARTGLGKAWRQKEAYEKAQEILLSALEEARGRVDSLDLQMGRAFYQLAVVYYYQKKLELARQTYERAQRIFALFPDEAGVEEANTSSSIGLVFNEEGKFDEAIAWFHRSLKRYTEMDTLNHPWVQSPYNGLGFAYDNKGDFPQAAHYYQKALEILESDTGKNKYFLANLYNNIGVMHQKQEDYGRAILYFEKSTALFQEQLGPRHPVVANPLGNLGVSYFNKEDTLKSDECFLNARDILVGALGQDHPYLGTTYNNIGQIFTRKRQHREAMAYYRKTIWLYRDFPVPKPEIAATATDNLAREYASLGMQDSALHFFGEALAQRKTRFGEFHAEVAKTYLHMGDFFASTGQNEAALEKYEQAIEATVVGVPAPYAGSLEKVYHKPVLLLCLAAKAEVLRRFAKDTASLNAALETYSLAARLIDLMRMAYQSVESKNTLLDHARKIYDGAVEICWALFQETRNRTYLEEAFRFSEQSRAVLLQASLRATSAMQYAGIPGQVVSRERSLRLDLAYYKKRMFDAEGSKDSLALSSLQARHFALQQSYDSLVAVLERDYPAYYQLKYQNQIATLEEVQAELRVRKAHLVAYHLTDSLLMIFSLGPAGTWEVKARPLSESFHGRLERFLHQLRDPVLADERGNAPETYEAFIREARYLYEVLLAPVWEGDPPPEGGRIILVPDGLLGYLPFEILLSSDPATGSQPGYAGLPYLFRSHSLRYAYSGGLLIETAQKSSRSGAVFGGFAPEYSLERYEGEETFPGPLFGNQPEVKALQQLVGGDGYLGAMATREAFRQEAGEYAVLHLAMHAFSNDKIPLYSGLCFADGILHSYELFSLPLKARLAVLSACNTGSGKLARGEGIISLARAFRYAGCPSIVMSLWQADDLATRELMEHFYRYLRKGFAKDEALRQARLDYLQQASLKHPHYWAAFVQLGEEAPIPLTPFPWPYLLGAFLLAVGLFVVWKWGKGEVSR